MFTHYPSRHFLPWSRRVPAWLIAVGFLCAFLASALDASAQGTISLAWDQNPEYDIAGYIVEYGENQGEYPSADDVGLRFGHDLTGLTPGGTYYVVVLAYNDSGMQSPRSAEVVGTASGALVPPPDGSGSAKTHLTAWDQRRPTCRLGVGRRPTCRLGVGRRPTCRLGVGRRPTCRLGVGRRPTCRLGVGRRPTCRLGVGRRPTCRLGVGRRPTCRLGVGRRPTCRLGVGRRPTCRLGVGRRPTCRLGVGRGPAIAYACLEDYACRIGRGVRDVESQRHQL